jgi:hypothetical protein
MSIEGWAQEFATPLLDDLALVPDATLVRGLRSDDREVRRLCARILATPGRTTPELVRAALAQDDVVTARILGHAAYHLGSPAVDLLWRCRVASLRALGLHHIQAREPAALALAASRTGALDRSPDVRLLARRHLVGCGVDVRALYRAALPAHPEALTGLAEVGDESDAAVIEPFLTDDRPQARAAALAALGRLRGSAARPSALAALADPSPAVVRTAGRVLAAQGLDPAALDRVWAAALATDRDRVRRSAFTVFAGQDRWVRLVIACRALDAGDEDLRRRGRALLDALLASWNRSATRPSAGQLAEIVRLAPALSPRLPPEAERLVADVVAGR